MSTKENSIKVLKIEPHKAPEVITIENELHALYKEIGCSLIEVIYLSPTAIIVIDEEGKLKKNPIGNRRFRNDVIVGNMLIVGSDAPEMVSLSDEDIALYSKYFEQPHNISKEEIKEHSGWKFSFF